MKYDKLVRDLIPDGIHQKGETVRFHTATDDEYRKKLREKLQEEVDEFLKAENAEELADIIEVIYALADEKNISRETLENIRQKKAWERGAFQKRIILDES